MSQVVRLDKISYPFPQTILGVDNNGNSVKIENGKFVTLLPQLLDYDVIPGVNVIDAERGIVALHHTPPVPKPTKELEQDFLLQEEKYGRAYILGIGDIVTIAGTNIETESGFKIGAEIGVSENGDIQVGKGQAIPFKLRALGTTSLEGIKAVILRVEESAMDASFDGEMFPDGTVPQEVIDGFANLNNRINLSDTKVATLEENVNNKVDKVEGKGLSTNDFTDEHLNLLNNALQSEDINLDNLDVDSLTLGSYVFTYNSNDDTLDVSYNGIEKVFVINKDQSIQANSIEAKE